MTSSQLETTLPNPKPWQRFLSGISQEFKDAVPTLAVTAAKGSLVVLSACALTGLLVKAEGYPLQARALVGAVAFSAIVMRAGKAALDMCDCP